MLLLIFLALVAYSQKANQAVYPENSSGVNTDSFSFKIFATPESTFGYNIYENKRLIIHQPHIPGMRGQKGFERESDARQVAMLVIEKLKKGIFPPTVTVDEMKSRNVKVD